MVTGHVELLRARSTRRGNGTTMTSPCKSSAERGPVNRSLVGSAAPWIGVTFPVNRETICLCEVPAPRRELGRWTVTRNDFLLEER
jgi:hypothetical protein